MVQNGSPSQAIELKAAIRGWAKTLGFSAIGFAPLDLGEAERRLDAWLAKGFHGEMDYMARHGSKRSHPAELVPGTRSIISVRMDYLPFASGQTVTDPAQAWISMYALGRDYHKVMRNRLQQLADRIESETGPFSYRAFADSAPVMEVELAKQAGLGWRGKHTLLLSRAGSWFFLGELFTDLDLPPDAPDAEHCGHCQRCIEQCPTAAIVAPYEVDARRCISYLTIEHPGAIPEALRPLMGNRIYGCDDCQLACPWNRFAAPSPIADFQPRQGLDSASLIELFSWTEHDFNARLAGSPIRRIGHERWLRNIAVALGNGPATAESLNALAHHQAHASALVREHVAWALAQLGNTR